MAQNLVIGVHIGQCGNPSCLSSVIIKFRPQVLDIKLINSDNYEGVSDELIRELEKRAEDYNIALRMNATGIGSPVVGYFQNKIVDYFRSKRSKLINLHILPVYLTGGREAVEKEGNLFLSKDLMVSCIKLWFQISKIEPPVNENTPEEHLTRFDKERLKLYKAVKQAVLNYETKVYVDPACWYPWDPKFKIGDHDPEAIAIGLACWPFNQE